MRILVAEDDAGIARMIEQALAAGGFIAEIVADGEEAWFRGDTESYAAIILDLGLPTMDGTSVLKRWRADGRKVPVLVLTARGSWAERVDGINAGADDYLPKPFHMDELLARLRALLRRSTGQSSPVLEAGPVSIDTRQMRASVDGAQIALTALEYRCLNFLMHNMGRVVSQLELTEHLYAQDHELESNAIEVLVGRLRRKLGAGIIETRRGYGYIIADARG